MMGSSANFHRSSFARSLSTIHRHQEAGDNPIRNGSAASKKRACRTSCENNSSETSRRAISPTSSRAMIDDLPLLPFTKDAKSSRDSTTTRERSSTKLHLHRRVSFAMDVESQGGAERPLQTKGLRKDYSLGETARSPAHMILNRSVGSLQKHDFAFIKRSDGTFSYAILAERSIRKSKNCKRTTEECMTFVMDDTGATKMIRRINWREFVRLVCPEGIVSRAA